MEEEKLDDHDGGGFQGGVVVKLPARSGVPNRAEQLAKHSRFWKRTTWLRLDVTCRHSKQPLWENAGEREEGRQQGGIGGWLGVNDRDKKLREGRSGRN